MSDIPHLGEFFSVATAVVWAFGVILFKKCGETVHPLALNLYKNTLAFVLISITMLVVGTPFLAACPPRTYVLLLISGALGIGLSDTFFFRSLNLVGAGLSAIVDCLYSPFIIGLSILFIGEKLTVLQTVGAAIIVSAVFLSAGRRGRADIPKHQLQMGYLYGVMAMASMAVGIVMIKPVLADLDVFWVVQIRIVGGMALLVLHMALHPRRTAILKSLLDKKGCLYASSGSFVGYYVALALWMAGMKYTQASVSAALNQTSTIFIFIFSALLLKEPLNRQRITAVALGVSGSLLVVFT